MKYFKYTFDNNVIALTTTTEIGNMAFQVGNNPSDVITNRTKVLNDLSIDKNHLVFVHQTHSDVIKEVTIKDLGKGSNDFVSGVEADALYTKEKGIALAIFHADCVPLFFYDPTVPLIGIIHAGYIGTIKKITYKALKEVIEKEHLNPDNIQVYAGPHRRKESFFVGEEQKEEILSANCLYEDGYFDATNSNINFVRACDINNIKDIQIDTVKDINCFSAYKKTPVGRMASIILLK